ncbi:DUF2637 domain-containing protein [Streptomyces sp. VNUA116]|uniref:DUF2637 domain-containing protein n=1 Tax=Streptomyces sp. VNUA116 TaxID=3062449 RepID=UPI002675EAB8|nr:DUF2637 domain-containing protein [Streptomyces sp. VNUA116]WKU45936.1 DUF2637 domain-containing protein [Streptomyces sp. VNUA116]
MNEPKITQRTVTVVMGLIAALAFVFSFGNVWALALRLGVPAPVAPLIAPMVDLSVVGLLVGLRYLSLRGIAPNELKSATRLMHLSGLLTLALNIAEPIAAGHYGRAAVDAVAPLLLLGWGQVGPQLLAHFHTTAAAPGSVSVPDPADAPAPVGEPAVDTTPVPAEEPASPAVPEPLPARVPEPAPGPSPVPASPAAPAPALPVASGLVVPEPLLKTARHIADTYRAEHGSPITPGQLKTRLGVGLPLATAALAQLTTTAAA